MAIKFWNGIALIENDTYRTQLIPKVGRLDHDQSLLRGILPHIPRGGVAIDVGANIGDHTIAYLNKVGITGRVLAFEPLPEAYECLKLNVPGAESYNYALSDQEETLNLVIRPNTGESFCSYSDNSQTIRAVPLDSFEFTQLDLIKFDVEGWELKALKGAEETIYQHQPRMVIEINEQVFKRTLGNRHQIYDFLRRHDYELQPIQPKTSLNTERIDLLAIPEKAQYFCGFQHKLGEAYTENSQLDQAIIAYRRGIGLNPKISSSHHNLGEVLEKQGHLEAAIAFYRKAIDLNPDHHQYHITLAKALARKAMAAEAVAEYRLGMSLNPNFQWSEDNFGEALLEGLYKHHSKNHSKGFQENPSQKNDLMSSSHDCGVIYLAIGEKFKREFLNAYKFFKKSNPTIPISLFTDCAIGELDGCTVYPLKRNKNPHKLKADILKMSPYEKTLFMDTDTLVIGDISDIFVFLDDCYLCIAKEPNVDYSKQPYKFIGYKSHKHINTGVFALKKCQFITKMIDGWITLMSEQDDSDMRAGHFGDQYYFNQLLQSGFFEQEGGKVKVIDNNIYNVRPQALPHLIKDGLFNQAKIIHLRLSAFVPSLVSLKKK
ncbi:MULTISPECIES: FkbM family methyltransferase [unclassified Moorena]|uniref:FkbM family methyltransferase n=1 Tax=unclassified Moorena TaxID=2683338 RepID=UPI0013B8FD6C|nr:MULTISPECIES: FkbM family methyltransferase [unclassified Moorena]NER86020.1 FkbM family methyltransferase [Moorena sp. SIO3A2]NES87506.1 FkbM family methyltransferase [Moorena sp. SIO2B7]NET64903.1 FkbM family methyltransferase [Moorena sp. SIO1G6]